MIALALVAVAAQLLADLTAARLVPVFRAYLAALIICLLYLGGSPTPAWMGLSVLVIKVAVTFEMVALLYTGIPRKEMRSVWFYSVAVGLVVLCLVWDLRQQTPLSHRQIVYVRQMTQVFIAMMSLAMTLFWWVHHYHRGFRSLHCWLITGLWINYAAIGIATPNNKTEWIKLDQIGSCVTILFFLTWIILGRAYPGGPGVPSGGGSS